MLTHLDAMSVMTDLHPVLHDSRWDIEAIRGSPCLRQDALLLFSDFQLDSLDLVFDALHVSKKSILLPKKLKTLHANKTQSLF